MGQRGRDINLPLETAEDRLAAQGTGGRDINLPIETEYDRIAARAIEFDRIAQAARQATKPKPPAKPPERGLLADFGKFAADVGIGAVKGAANTAMAITPLTMLPAGGEPGNITPFEAARRVAKPEGLAQNLGTFVPDVAMAVGTGGGSAVSQGIRTAANVAERSAIPGLTREGAELALKNTAGRLSAGNTARAVQAAQPALRRTPSAAVTNVADSMTAAMAQPSRPLVNDLLAGSAGGYFGGKGMAGLVTALRLLNRPGVKSGLAQGAYSAAPVLGAAGGGLGLNAARQLSEAERREAILRQLGAGRPDQR